MIFHFFRHHMNVKRIFPIVAACQQTPKIKMLEKKKRQVLITCAME